MNYNQIEVHILKNLLGLTDETYRYMLSSNYQAVSSKDLNNNQLNTLVNSLKYLFNSNKNHLTYEQFTLIKKLAKGKINSLPAYIGKIINKTKVNISSLTRPEASLIIRTLKNYKK